MLSKTSIQAMYINRVKDLKALNAKWDKLIDLRANGEDVDDFLYNVEDDLKRAVIEFELLRLILDEDVGVDEDIKCYHADSPVQQIPISLLIL